VALAGFSTLLHQTDRTIGQIAHANSQLALLANMPDQDPTKAAFAQTIVDYIGANLIDAPEILNQNLGSHVALADNVVKSASRLMGKRKFFGTKSSAEVRSVYEYFAAYQAQLAMLLQEYYHAKPTVYSPTNNAANLSRLHKDVESQAGSLKPDMPANKAYQRLIDGWSGKSPSHWLHQEAGLSGRVLSAFGYQKWIKAKYRLEIHGLISSVGIETFDPYSARVDTHCLYWSYGAWKDEFAKLHAGLMYVRKLTPDESYWWST
jgi:hypothetical protein